MNSNCWPLTLLTSSFWPETQFGSKSDHCCNLFALLYRDIFLIIWLLLHTKYYYETLKPLTLRMIYYLAYYTESIGESKSTPNKSITKTYYKKCHICCLSAQGSVLSFQKIAIWMSKKLTFLKKRLPNTSHFCQWQFLKKIFGNFFTFICQMVIFGRVR